MRNSAIWAAELLSVLRNLFKFGKQIALRFVIVQRPAHQDLQLLVLSQHRKQVPLFKFGEQIELFLELSEESFARFYGARGCVGELREELVSGRWGSLNKLSNGGHSSSRAGRSCARRQPEVVPHRLGRLLQRIINTMMRAGVRFR